MDGNTDETAGVEDQAPQEQVTPAQLVDYLGRASFQETRGRKGYTQSEVHGFLTRLAEAVQEGEPLRDIVRKAHFTPVRFEDGYDMVQVDDFLAAVVDLDPHAHADRPEPERSGLITKLFG